MLPLVDDRGFGEASLASWIAQTLEPDLFEIIAVANDPDRPLVRRAREMVRARDRVLVFAGADEIDLYRLGGLAAAADLLLFTESHCIAAPEAARALVGTLGSSNACAAIVSGVPIRSNVFAGFESRLFDEGLRRNPQDLWRRVGLRGLAVRRAAWEEAGEFETSCGRLAESILAVRLQRLGGEIVDCREASVRHGNCSRMRDLFSALFPSGRGQAEWRRRCEEGLEEEFLPPLEEWSDRARWHRSIARHAARLLLATAARAAKRGDWRRSAHAARAVPGFASAAVLGSLGVRAVAAARAAWFLARSRYGFFEEPRYRCYSRASSELLRWGVLDRVMLPLPKPPNERVLHPADLPDGVFVEFHAAERFSASDSRPTCRWTRPFSMMRLGLPADDYLLTIDARSPVAPEKRSLRLFFNGHPLEGTPAEGFRIRKDVFRPGEQLLTFVCRPFRPAQSGLPDTRELGVALFELHFRGPT